MFIINGVKVKAPKSFQVDFSDIDANTGRNANGTIVRDRVATKRKLICEWGMLTQNEIQDILNSVDPVFFEVTYPDPRIGITTKIFYAGDKSMPAYSFEEPFKPWAGLKMNLIEK